MKKKGQTTNKKLKTTTKIKNDPKNSNKETHYDFKETQNNHRDSKRL